MTEATTTAAVADAFASDTGGGGEGECWCCGRQFPGEQLLHLGAHPEAVVCLGCAHFLHHQARQREDARNPSIAARMRDGLRWCRRVVIDHQWHQRPVIGRPLRWLGRHLP